ncbi:MAG: hypothetical protein ACXWTP_03345 [Methylosarcina sp.]
MISILPFTERRRLQLHWVIQSAAHFASNIKNHNDADLSAACRVAAENFLAGESGARSIYKGFDHARQAIKGRQAPQPTFNQVINP